MKICSKCNTPRSNNFYYKSDRHKDGHYSICKDCVRTIGRARYKANPAKFKEIQDRYFKNNPNARTNTRLKHVFGITKSDYDRMLEMQSGKCAICANSPTNRVLDVDHCHTTGKIRGLLCNKCNQGIGLLRDNIEILTKAISYLEKNS